MKDFCQQKGIRYIDNSNITENHLHLKKLLPNSKGNTAFAKNLKNFTENLENSPIWRDSDEHKSLRKFCKTIKIVHINISFIRNKLDLLSDQVKGNVDILIVSETKIDESFRYDNSKLMDLIHLFELIETRKVVAQCRIFGKICQQKFCQLIELTTVVLLS